jgi:hypothetical protein
MIANVKIAIGGGIDDLRQTALTTKLCLRQSVCDPRRIN